MNLSTMGFTRHGDRRGEVLTLATLFSMLTYVLKYHCVEIVKNRCCIGLVGSACSVGCNMKWLAGLVLENQSTPLVEQLI